jgi:Na+/H+-translocating membrane pyrophosphatase
LGPIISIILFPKFVSKDYGNQLAFSAMMISIIFMEIAMYILHWILQKDSGSFAMKEIGDPIKEGSEGYFKTQFGTIFKLAFFVSFIIFALYYNRAPASKELGDILSPFFIASFTAFAFFLGANFSALSGYAGIWVSVRANLRVASASRKCYNDALQICFRGGAFSAIINVALAIFGLSSMYLILYFALWYFGDR